MALWSFGPWAHGFRRPWSVGSSRCYAGKAPFSVLSPLTGSRQAAWSAGIGLFLLGTQKANCKRAITGTAALLPLPFCSIWDLTAVVSTCVFCTVAGTGVYATLLLHQTAILQNFVRRTHGCIYNKNESYFVTTTYSKSQSSGSRKAITTTSIKYPYLLSF